MIHRSTGSRIYRDGNQPFASWCASNDCRTVLLWELPCSRSKQCAYPDEQMGENCGLSIKRPLCAHLGSSEPLGRSPKPDVVPLGSFVRFRPSADVAQATKRAYDCRRFRPTEESTSSLSFSVLLWLSCAEGMKPVHWDILGASVCSLEPQFSCADLAQRIRLPAFANMAGRGHQAPNFATKTDHTI